jgi:hypothetical protein
MNTEKIIIFVHGMGKHTKASVEKDFIGSFDNALSLYPSANGKKLKNTANVQVFTYDKVFKSYLSKIETEADSVGDAISKVGGNASLVTKGLALANKLDKRITKDDFFSSHWLDVVFYYFTLLGESIRLNLATEINTAINKVGAINVHIVAHSLGCSLVHDTLEKLYGSATLKDESGLKKLNITSNKLGSVHMIANVSRALQSFSKVRQSIVRPGLNGCTRFYTEYRHKLDPIPQIKPFNPTNNGNWVSHADFNRYNLFEPCSITDANTHAIDHYIGNPMVHLELFKQLIRFVPRTKAEKNAVEAEYLTNTLSGQADNLQQLVDGVSIDSKESVNNLISAAIDFKNFVAGFGGSFK